MKLTEALALFINLIFIEPIRHNSG